MLLSPTYLSLSGISSRRKQTDDINSVMDLFEPELNNDEITIGKSILNKNQLVCIVLPSVEEVQCVL